MSEVKRVRITSYDATLPCWYANLVGTVHSVYLHKNGMYQIIGGGYSENFILKADCEAIEDLETETYADNKEFWDKLHED